MNFNKNFILFNVLIGAILAVLVYATTIIKHAEWVWMGFAFFAIVAYASYSFVMKGEDLPHNRFIGRFLGLTISRIILTAIFLAIYLIVNAERDIVFVVLFMLLYLFYTLFEIYHLVTKLRADNYNTVEDTKS